MSAESWKLEKDLCRCCHAEGSFHNLSQPLSLLGKEEVYSEMLRSALNIDILPMPGLLCTMTYTICDDCALRLRDATHFRQQVMMCEERFKDMYQNVLQALTPNKNALFEVKVEPPASCDTDTLPENNDFPEDPEINTRNCKIVTPHLPKLEIPMTTDFGYGDADDLFDDDDDNDILSNFKVKPKCKVPKRKNQSADGVNTKKGSVKMSTFSLKDIDYKKEGKDFVCKHCDMRYPKKMSLRVHVKTKHYNIVKRLKCQYCNEEFLTQARIMVHKLDKHNVDDRYKCQACDAAFHTDKQLRNHRNQYHMLGKTYKCELCEYETFAAGGVYRHMFKHKTKKDYHCRFCKKSFLRKATLKLHERIHTGDRRKVCKECGQAFVQKASLNYHMTKYHPSINF